MLGTHPYIFLGVLIAIGAVCAWGSYRWLTETPVERLNRDFRRSGRRWGASGNVIEDAKVIAMDAWKASR